MDAEIFRAVRRPEVSTSKRTTAKKMEEQGAY